MNRRINLVSAAFALTALTYGLARFAFGLLLPEIRGDLSLSAAGAGWIGGSAFAAYCFGIVFAFASGARLGDRRIAVLAGVIATCGLSLVAAASSGWSLGLAMTLAGLSTGLTSPPLAAAVARCLEDSARPRANGAINAGTAAGIIFSGIAVMTFAGGWRALYALFAAIGATVTIWLWFAMPKAARARASNGSPSVKHLTREGVARLCAAAFLMGAASTAIWTFGANIMRDDLGFSDARIALSWIVLGAAGTAGAGTGILTTRFGIGPVHRVAVSVMALALIGLAASFAPTLAFAVMGLFGVAYIVSSGAFLLWGIALFPDRPDFGLGLPFLMIALGQTTGAPLFGYVWDLAGSATALLSFATTMGSAAIWTATSTCGKGTALPTRRIRYVRGRP